MGVKRLLAIAGAFVAAGLAALTVNLLLVDYASSENDPVGKLSPRAVLTPTQTATTTAGRDVPRTSSTTTTDAGTRPTTTSTTHATTTDEDGDHGRNRGRGGDGSEDDD